MRTNRRDFLKSTFAASALPLLPLAVRTEPKDVIDEYWTLVDCSGGVLSIVGEISLCELLCVDGVHAEVQSSPYNKGYDKEVHLHVGLLVGTTRNVRKSFAVMSVGNNWNLEFRQLNGESSALAFTKPVLVSVEDLWKSPPYMPEHLWLKDVHIVAHMK